LVGVLGEDFDARRLVVNAEPPDARVIYVSSCIPCVLNEQYRRGAPRAIELRVIASPSRDDAGTCHMFHRQICDGVRFCATSVMPPAYFSPPLSFNDLTGAGLMLGSVPQGSL
jgi:hypothetical protein